MVTSMRLREWFCNKWHPFWDVEVLASQFSGHSGHDAQHGSVWTRYPVRSLRYWFMYHLMCQEYYRRQRPLEVCEIGIGEGPMLAFVKNAEARKGRTLQHSIRKWDGVSRRMSPVRLHRLGYSHCLEKNIEEPALTLPQQYDVLILLHILEHLYEPDRALVRLLPFLRAGGVVIGGHPSIPDILRHRRERRLRKTAQPFGHVSAFSARRIKDLARQQDLKLEFLTGAYLLRKSGGLLENYRAWLRLNLLFGSVCPFWPGELYWAMRKVSKGDAVGIQTGASLMGIGWSANQETTAVRESSSDR